MATEEILINIQVSDVMDQLKKTTDEINRLKKSNEQLTKRIKNGEDAQGKYAQRLQENKIDLKELSSTAREYEKQIINEIKANKANEGSLVQMRAQLSNLTKAYDNLSQTERTGAKGKEFLSKIQLTTENLRLAEEESGRFQRSVGNYPQMMQQAVVGNNRFLSSIFMLNSGIGGIRGGLMQAGKAAVAFGAQMLKLLLNPVVLVTAAVVGLGAAAVNLIKNSMEFSKTMSQVKAVTGATASEMNLLKENAKQVGATTLKTATEVAQLQFELSKLGFTVPEILNATAAITDLSIATGAEMGRSAEVLGNVIRSMGLTADESVHVADVMAKSFSSSALDMEKFAESFKYVGPVAKSTNTSLEETSAMLAVLANNGISGSNAGTALRMIMLKLGEESGTLTEKITKLSEKGLSLADANDEVGQRALTALLVLADQSKQLPIFQKSFENANGAVKEMSRIMSDNLEGDLTLLGSTWDGFKLSLEDGDGILTQLARGSVQLVIDAIISLNEGLKKIKEGFDRAMSESQAFRVAIELWKQSFVQSFATLKFAIKSLVNYFISSFKIIDSAIRLDFDGVKKEYKNFLKEQKKILDERVDKAVEGAKKIKYAYSEEAGAAYKALKEKAQAESDFRAKMKQSEKDAEEREKKEKESAKEREKRLKEEQKTRENSLKIEQQLQDAVLRNQKESIDKQIEQERIATQRKIDELNKETQLTVEGKKNRDKLIEQLQLESDNKIAEIKEKATEENLKKAYDAEMKLLNNQLAAVEKNSQKELDLKLQIAEKNRQQEVAQEDLTEAEIFAINEKYRVQNEEAQKAFDERVAQEQLDLLRTNLENKLAVAREGSNAELALQLEKLEMQRVAEVEAAEKTGADVALINAKYEKLKESTSKRTQQQQLDTISSTLGEASNLFDKESKAYKITATAEAIMNTYKAATAALASGSKISPIFGIASATIAVATGLKSVAEINKVKLAGGGVVPGFGSGDTVPAMLTPGEIVLNKAQQTNLVKSLSVAPISGGIDYEALAATMSLARPRVSVEEISDVNDRVDVLESLGHY